jgi:hypothetical protein
VRLDELQASDFEARLGQEYALPLRDGRLPLVLLEVAELPEPGPSVRRGFSLVFRSARPGALPQGTYALEHPELGQLEIFIVPIGPRDGGMCYEAVFG